MFSEHHGKIKGRDDLLFVAVGSNVSQRRECERRRGRHIDRCSNRLKGCLERNETSEAVSHRNAYLLDRVPDVDGKSGLAKLCEGWRITTVLPGEGCLLTGGESGRGDRGGELFTS